MMEQWEEKLLEIAADAVATEESQKKTLRDEFAMAALSALLVGDRSGYSFTMAAADAYDYADAMLEARKNG